MMSYAAYCSLIIVSAVVLLPLDNLVAAGPLDSFSWARADKIPIDVNLPWLPCKCPFYFSPKLPLDFRKIFVY